MGNARVVLGLLLAAALVVTVAWADDDPKCDVKTTRVDKVCVVCDEVVKKGNTHCDEEVEKVEFCIKIVYVCEDCDETAEKPGKCPGCDEKLTKTEDKARTLWACPECGDESDEKGKCEECDKALVKTCEKSGTPPHVAASKKGKE